VWSITLYVGNPTNIIMANAEGVNFLSYSKWMTLPAITAGLTLLLTLWAVFHHKIPHIVECPDISPESALKNKNGAIFGCFWLFLCLIGLATADYSGLPMWFVTLFFGSVMFLIDIYTDIKKHNFDGPVDARTYKVDLDREGEEQSLLANEKGTIPKGGTSINSEVSASITDTGSPTMKDIEEPKGVWDRIANGQTGYVVAHMPWRVLPFVIAMFILVQHLETVGVVEDFARALASVIKDTNVFTGSIFMTTVGVLSANILNNQPMTILFSKIVGNEAFDVSDKIHRASVFLELSLEVTLVLI